MANRHRCCRRPGLIGAAEFCGALIQTRGIVERPCALHRRDRVSARQGSTPDIPSLKRRAVEPLSPRPGGIPTGPPNTPPSMPPPRHRIHRRSLAPLHPCRRFCPARPVAVLNRSAMLTLYPNQSSAIPSERSKSRSRRNIRNFAPRRQRPILPISREYTSQQNRSKRGRPQ